MSVSFVPVSVEKSIDSSGCAGTVLMVTPHPDDDVIGAGGTMAGHAAHGFLVVSAYVTGGAGDSGRHDEVTRLRRHEALAALQTVGAAGAFFLDYKSRDLAGEASAERAVSELAGIISCVQPETIYAPCPFERHRTHLITTELTVKALRNADVPVRSLLGYAVWSAIQGMPGTKTVDISKHLNVKKEAIQKHVSQIRIKPYDQAALGKNAWEGICMHTHSSEMFFAAETFFDMTALITHPDYDLKEYAQDIARNWLDTIYQKP